MALTVVSTTDDENQVRAAAGLEPLAAASPEGASSESGDGSGPSDETPEESSDPKAEVEGAESAEGEAVEGEESEESEEPEGTEGEEPAVAAAAKPKTKGGFQKKIDKLTGRNKELETETVSARRLISDLQYQLAEAKRAPAAAAKAAGEPVADGATEQDIDKVIFAKIGAEPDPNDEKFKTVGEFMAAFRDWNKKAISITATETARIAREEAAKVQSNFDAQRETDSQTQARSAAVAGYNARVSEILAVHPDFHEVFTNNQSSPLAVEAIANSPQIQGAIVSHPLGAHLAYRFGKNPDEVVRIAKLPPQLQLMEIGSMIRDIQVDLDKGASKSAGKGKSLPAAKPAPAVKASTAPKPANTGGKGKATGTGKLTPSQASSLSFSEYKRARAEGRI